jgi:hypothetical protein
MFTVIPNGPNRIDIEFSGKLNSEQMKLALDELIEKAAGIENGRMLYIVGSFQLPTFAAMVLELSYVPRMFGLIRRFKRCAVLADQKWLKTIGEIEGALIPGLEIKGFNTDEKAAAEAWLAEG